jgi:multiple sugar transport system ATP-binding protein
VTTVYVTHDQSEALALADRMAVMEAGRIRQLGTPSEVFHRPANLFVAGFIGSTPMNLLPARVEGGALRVAGGRLPLPAGAAGLLADGEDATLGARPEYIALGPGGVADGLPGTVAILENLGTGFLVSVECAGAVVQAVVPEGREPRIGDQVTVRVDRDRALVYRASDGELVGPPAPHLARA